MGLMRAWNARLKVFLGRCKFKTLDDKDMIADAKNSECGRDAVNHVV